MTRRKIGGVEYTLTYDAENRLVGYTGGSINMSFVYDGDGNRILARQTNGDRVGYVGDYEAVYNSAGMNTAKRVYYRVGPARVMQGYGTVSGIRYLLTDHQGSTIAMASDTALLGTLVYSPWGYALNGSGSIQSDVRYTGQHIESSIGIYYYGARWYDPFLNRWLSPDSMVPDPSKPVDWDRFAYVRNSPVLNTDPSGHRTCQNKDDCADAGTTPFEAEASRHPKEPWKDDANYDETTNSILGWCNGGCLKDTSRIYNARKVWTWICKSGGWWGSGCPSGKALAAFLLWREGGEFFNISLYKGKEPEIVARIMVGYFSYLFEDKDGITPNELSKFTAFFNPKLGSVFNSTDWDYLVNGPVPSSTFSSIVDAQYGIGPVVVDDHIVGRWWDNKESTPCDSCSIYMAMPIVNDPKKYFYFGYLP